MSRGALCQPAEPRLRAELSAGLAGAEAAERLRRGGRQREGHYAKPSRRPCASCRQLEARPFEALLSGEATDRRPGNADFKTVSKPRMRFRPSVSTY